MRHLFLLIFIACCIYVGWHLTPSDVRAYIGEIVRRHGPRLALIIGAILGIALLVYIFPAFNII